MLRSFFASILLCARPAAAQQAAAPGGGRYTLAELVQRAMQDAKLLASQDARVEEARFSAEQAKAWPGPSTDLLLGRTRQTQASGARFALTLTQPLPLSGKPGLRGDLLELEAESWRVRRVESQIYVTLDVARLAYGYAAERRKSAFVEKRQRRFDLIRTYLAGRSFPTPQGRAESRIVQNRLKSLLSDLIRSQAAFRASLQRLRAYTALEPGATPEIEVPWLSGARGLDESEWLKKALAGNPGLRLRRLAARGAELEGVLASREGVPDTALVASYEKGQADITGTDYGLGLSLALPSWNRNRSGIRSARQRRLSEERNLEFDERKLMAELPRALVEYEAARLIVIQYPQSLLAELDAHLEEAEGGFRKGQVNLLTFLELDDSAAEAYARVLDAQLNLVEKAAQVLAAAGEVDALARLGGL